MADWHEQECMDNLVLQHAAFSRAANLPRELVTPADRNQLEHACDEIERRFVAARDSVRNCRTFRSLVPQKEGGSKPFCSRCSCPSKRCFIAATPCRPLR